MTPYRACDVELAARVSKLALSFSSQNIRLPLHQCIVSPLRLLPFFSSFLFLVAEQGSIYARRPPSSLSLSLSPSLAFFPLPPPIPRFVYFKIFFISFFFREKCAASSREKETDDRIGFLSFLFLLYFSLFDLFPRSRIG